MSRRHRLDLERADEIKNEDDEEENKEKLQRDRIYAPLVWATLADGIKIQDLKPHYHQEVVQLFRDYYLSEDVLCRNTGMKDDEPSIQSFLYKLLFVIKDSVSIVAIREYAKPKPQNVERKDDVDDESEAKRDRRKNNKEKEEMEQEVVACLVMKVTHEGRFGSVFSRVCLIDGEAYTKCAGIINTLTRKVNIFDIYKCANYLRYHALCVKPSVRGRGLGFQLLKCGLKSARAMKITTAMGVFTNYKLQKLAKKLGMQVLMEINYTDWRDKDGELIFEDPGAGNNAIALMGGVIPPPTPPKSSRVVVTKELEKPVKKTRSEKRSARYSLKSSRASTR